ncbi:hypothetical protein NPIL_506221, partial [Nephila pilipes]
SVTAVRDVLQKWLSIKHHCTAESSRSIVQISELKFSFGTGTKGINGILCDSRSSHSVVGAANAEKRLLCRSNWEQCVSHQYHVGRRCPLSQQKVPCRVYSVLYFDVSYQGKKQNFVVSTFKEFSSSCRICSHHEPSQKEACSLVNMSINQHPADHL